MVEEGWSLQFANVFSQVVVVDAQVERLWVKVGQPHRVPVHEIQKTLKILEFTSDNLNV